MSKKILPTLGPVETSLPERTFERNAGCWNCRHSSHDMAKKFWIDKRQQDLAIVLSWALESPLGEKDPRVEGYRSIIDQTDHGVASRGLLMCLGHGFDKNGGPVGDLIGSVHCCPKWDGAQGASIARGGEALNPLAAELEDKIS